MSKATVNIFFCKHKKWSFMHSNSKIVLFFLRNGKFYYFFCRKSLSVIQSDFNEVSFFYKKFWFSNFCVCSFFQGKVEMSFHLVFGAEQKSEKKSFFIHPFDIPQKFAKTNFSGEIKNKVPLGVPFFLSLKNVKPKIQ